jgi:hypothetical protein
MKKVTCFIFILSITFITTAENVTFLFKGLSDCVYSINFPAKPSKILESRIVYISEKDESYNSYDKTTGISFEVNIFNLIHIEKSHRKELILSLAEMWLNVLPPGSFDNRNKLIDTDKLNLIKQDVSYPLYSDNGKHSWIYYDSNTVFFTDALLITLRGSGEDNILNRFIIDEFVTSVISVATKDE